MNTRKMGQCFLATTATVLAAIGISAFFVRDSNTKPVSGVDTTGVAPARHVGNSDPKTQDDLTFDCSGPFATFGAMSVSGGYLYKIEKVSPGKCRWVIDHEAMDRAAKEESRKRELLIAMQRRVLSDEEMKEALSYGDDLNIQNGQPYFADQKQKELNEAFLQQWRLRAASNPTGEKSP